MAVRQVRSCDVDGAEDATQHILAYDGLFTAIDLCTKCEQALEKALGPTLEVGTEISAAEARKLTASSDQGQEVDPAAVRTWCAAQRPVIQVGAKGRIPSEVMAQYLAANPPPE